MRPLMRAAALLLVAALSAACGARLTTDQLELATSGGGGAASGPGAVGSGGSGTGGSGSGGGSGGATGASTTLGASTGAGGGPAAGGGATAGQGGGGSGADAGPGDGAGAGAPCSPQPSDEPGVSDSEIRIGNVSTISGPIAGFANTARNGALAYVAMVNAQGGVCGRQLNLVLADDGLDAGRNRSETQRLANDVIGFAGSLSVVDDGGADILEGTNIPDSTLSIGTRRAGLANNFSPNPVPPGGTSNGNGHIFEYFAAQGVDSAAIVWPNQADARFRGQIYINDLNAAGITNIRTFEVQIAETNYVSVAQEIENHGSKLIITTLEVSGMARLAQAFQQVGYRPQIPFYGAQAYGQQFIDQATPAAAEGTTLASTHILFDDPVPAMQEFNTWYQRVAPGSKPDFFSILSWSAMHAFVDALRAAGPAPTRDAMIAHFRTLTEFTADGLLAPRNLPGKTTGLCFLVVTVRNGSWVRVDPPTGFINC